MLNRQDPYDKFHIVKLKDDFMWRNCHILVFEWLSINLVELLKQNNHLGESLDDTRTIGLQIATTLRFLSLNNIKVVHCDLKPENILLCNPKSKEIKIIDFGLSCRYGQRSYKTIQSVYYRSPEVLLGNNYDCAADVWSLGCILVELHTGQVLFNSNNEIDQMNKIVEVLGMPPKDFLDRSSETKKYFNKLPNGNYLPNTPNKTHNYGLPKLRKLNEIIGVYTGGPGGRRLQDVDHSVLEYLKFEDLVKQMLEFDPLKRIKPDQILEHEFFQTKKKATVENWVVSARRRSVCPDRGQ